jgi:integrase
LCEGKDGDELVFQRRSRPGEPIVAADLYRRFINACKRAGLPRLSFHELRHTFGTQAIRKFKIHEVQRMMGHRHITTTERYLHYAPTQTARRSSRSCGATVAAGIVAHPRARRQR